MHLSVIHSFLDHVIPKKTYIKYSKENYKKEIALVIHIYYIDFFYDVILPKISQLSFPFDLLISTRNSDAGKIFSEVSELKPDSFILVKGVENVGYDMYPFTCIFSEYYSDYRYICKIHTKKSEYDRRLHNWGRYLVYNLLGNDRIVFNILAQFEKNKRLGIIFPESFSHVKPMMEWGSNYENTVHLFQKMGLNPPMDKNNLVFPAGSMFWFRPESLKPLFSLSLNTNEFSSNFSHPRDGTLAHAIERSIVYVAKQCGYEFIIMPGKMGENDEM